MLTSSKWELDQVSWLTGGHWLFSVAQSYGALLSSLSFFSGSVCTTRKKTGVGYPQLSAVMECADAAHGLKGHIISVRSKGRAGHEAAKHLGFLLGMEALIEVDQDSWVPVSLEVDCWDTAERAWAIHAVSSRCFLLCRMEAAALLGMWPRLSVRTLGGHRRRIL